MEKPAAHRSTFSNVSRRQMLKSAAATTATLPTVAASLGRADQPAPSRHESPNKEGRHVDAADAASGEKSGQVHWPESAFRSVTVAAISVKPKPWDKQANADKMERLYREAADRGARIAIVPEGALEGYVVNDVLRKPELAARMLKEAEPLDGPYVMRFRDLARKLDMCLSLAFAERIGNEIFNTAIMISEKGDICGKYHKVQFAEGYHPSWSFNRLGTTIRAFDCPFGRAGILICNDQTNPMLPRILVLDGAQVIFIPTYSGPSDRVVRRLLSMGRDNGVPIVLADAGGGNVIVSRGELVTREIGHDLVTVAPIDIPVAASEMAARRLEREFLAWRKPEMEKRYTTAMQNIRAGKPPVPVTPPVILTNE